MGGEGGRERFSFLPKTFFMTSTNEDILQRSRFGSKYEDINIFGRRHEHIGSQHTRHDIIQSLLHVYPCHQGSDFTSSKQKLVFPESFPLFITP